MKIGIRKPSLKKSIAARTSVKRAVRHKLGLKAPRGLGWATHPKKAAYNRVYRKTTKGCGKLFLLTFMAGILLVAILVKIYG
jgi:hypothetical protein